MSNPESQAIIAIIKLVYKASDIAIEHYLTHDWMIGPLNEKEKSRYKRFPPFLFIVCKVCHYKTSLDITYEYSVDTKYPPKCTDYLIKDIIE